MEFAGACGIANIPKGDSTMLRHRDVVGSFPMRSLATVLLLVVSSLAIATSEDRAFAQVAKNTDFYLFNAVPGGDYDVTKNSDAPFSASGSARGALRFSSSARSGDRFVIILNGVSVSPPSVPTGLTALGDNVGCASLSWNANPESDIVGYTIYYGTSSVAQGQASAYSDSLVVLDVTTGAVCGLPDGTYYFALKARNGFGLWSGYSSEASTDVTNGNTTGPLPPQQVQVNETTPGCVNVTWQANSEPTIGGYVVYYGPQSVAQGQTSVYPDSQDVGNTTSTDICGFSQGPQYFAVRAYTTAPVEYSGYSTERTLNIVGPDVTPPTISAQSPADGQTQVPTDPQVFFVLTDAQSGVDTNSVTVTINGVSPSNIRFLGDPSSYSLRCDLSGMLPAQSVIDVVVSASDRAASPNTLNSSWSFTTGSGPDTSPPVFSNESPLQNAINVDPFAPVSVRINDSNGVDFATIIFEIDGVVRPYTWDIQTGTIQYENGGGFTSGTTVSVRVTACDLSASRNCATLQYTFDVADPPLGGEVAGAIVPDGYWANEPARPLEIVNMPQGWTVRIFDTAGSEVRSFRNDQSDGYTWSWDFRNDRGSRVAQTLYLVRVIDESGAVRNSGRFLVQSN